MTERISAKVKAEQMVISRLLCMWRVYHLDKAAQRRTTAAHNNSNNTRQQQTNQHTRFKLCCYFAAAAVVLVHKLTSSLAE